LKIRFTHTITYLETDTKYKAKFSVLFRYLQDAAILHSEKAGYRMDSFIQGGQGWVLNKMDMKVFRYPEYQETIEMITWSRSINGVKAKREFFICNNREKLIAASSVWVFVDSIRMKIMKTPEEMEARYTVEPETAWNENLEQWRADRILPADCGERISTRISDYDPMGHINNTVYFDFIETAISRKIGTPVRISGVKIQFIHELHPNTFWVNVGLQKADGKYLFTISDDQHVNAAGELFLEAV